MQKINDWENVQEAGDFKKPMAGGYVFVVDSVVDKVTMSGKHYLEISCDIAEGEFKGFAKQAEIANGNKYSYRKMKAYYDGNAKGLFKRFINAVTECNRGFVWNWDENALVGKVFGAVLAEREYMNGDKVAVATEIHYPSTTTIAKIHNGDFKLIPRECLDNAPAPAPAPAPASNASQASADIDFDMF